jgi:bla regulator protein blaR1
VSFQALLDDPLTAALGWALLHSLWQLALVATLAASADLVLRNRSAQARYLTATGALLLMMGAPAATFVMVQDADPAPARAARTTVRAAAFVAEEEDVGGEARAVEGTSGLVPRSRSRAAAAPAAGPLASLRLERRLAAALPAFVLAWAAGVGLLSVRVLGGWVVAQRLKRSGRPVAVEAWSHAAQRLCRRMRVWLPVRLCESALVEVPTVIGWLRPVVLLPASTLVGLSPAQLEALLAHELAHVRRFDYLVNLVQTMGETLLFYHPAVWWVSHRMRVEREHCCDDAAVAVCGDAVGYARALAELEGRRGVAPALAVAADGGCLWLRVARLVGAPPAHLPRSSRWVAGLFALGTLTALGLSAGGSLEGATARRRESVSARLKPADYGVTAEYVRRLAELGYDGLSDAKLVALRTSGVSPSYVAALKEAGYEALSVSRLIMLRSHGVTPDYVGGLQELGYPELSPLRLVALRTHGVTPGYVEGLKDLGYDGLSVPVLIGLRTNGVDPEFVQELQDEGLAGLEAGELLALRKNGVTGRYVGRLKAAGYEELTTEQLIALRQSGAESKEQDAEEPKPCAEKKRHSEEEEE